MASEKPSAYRTADGPVSFWEVWGRSLYTYRLMFALIVGGALLDQFTKTWVASILPYGAYHEPHRINVIEGFFHIVHIGNEGAAWGILQGQGFFLALFSIGCLVAIYLFRESLHLHRTPCQLAFGFLIGGVIGNLVDRLWRGHVIDFLDFHLGFYVWPSFNVADMCIFLGVATYLVYSFFLEHRYPPKKKIARELK